METPDMKRPREAENNTLKASRNSRHEDHEKNEPTGPQSRDSSPERRKKTALRSIIRYNFGPPRLYQMDRHAQMCTLVCNVSMATIDVIEKNFLKNFKKV